MAVLYVPTESMVSLTALMVMLWMSLQPGSWGADHTTRTFTSLSQGSGEKKAGPDCTAPFADYSPGTPYRYTDIRRIVLSVCVVDGKYGTCQYAFIQVYRLGL